MVGGNGSWWVERPSTLVWREGGWRWGCVGCQQVAVGRGHPPLSFGEREGWVGVLLAGSVPWRSVGERRGVLGAEGGCWMLKVGAGNESGPSRSVGERRGLGWAGSRPGDPNGPVALYWGAEGAGFG